MPKYERTIYEKADCIWEGYTVDGVLKAFSYCCGLDEFVGGIEFGETQITADEMRIIANDNTLLKVALADPAVGVSKPAVFLNAVDGLG